MHRANRYRHLLLAALLLVCLGTIPLNGQNNPSRKSGDRIRFDTYFGQGVVAFSLSQYDEAFALLSHAYQIDSTDGALCYQLSALYNAMGYSSKAYEMLQRAYASDSNNRYYAEALGSLQVNRNQYAEAIQIYKKLSKDYPEEDNLQYLLAHLYTAQGDIAAAEKIYNRLVDQAKDASEAARSVEAKVQLLSAQNRTDEALAAYRKLSARFPDEPGFILPYVGGLIDAEQYPQAREQLQQLKRIDSTSGIYHFAMASYYAAVDSTARVQQELSRIADDPNVKPEQKLPLISRFVFSDTAEDNVPKAIYNTLFDRMLLTDPTDIPLRLIYARVLQMQQNIPAATRVCAPVTEMDPSNAQGWSMLLSLTVEQGDKDRIRAVSRQARQHIPGQALFYVYQAIADYEDGNKKAARAILSEATLNVTPQTDPSGLSDVYSMLGDLAHEANNEQESFAHYEKALELNPDNVGVLNNYAFYLGKKGGDLEKALRLANRCVQLAPQNPTYLDTYGYLYFLKGQYAIAKLYISKAIDHSPETPDADIVEHLGDVLYKLGQSDEAVVQWQKAKELGNGGSDTLDEKIRTRSYIQ